MRLIRGWIGEKKTLVYLWFFIDIFLYKRFHNIIIPSKNGSAQIDHLLISPFGLFIIETKNIKGWVFGSENDRKWTQTLYKEKYSFQNPIKQTFRQKKVLCEFLGIGESIVHPIVYFVGDCEFKTPLPANVMNSGLARYILRFKEPMLTVEQADFITRDLKKQLSESTLTRRDHIRSLRKRHASTTVCPRCGSNLVERTAKKGPNAGSIFLGCESYPRCRFSKDA